MPMRGTQPEYTSTIGLLGYLACGPASRTCAAAGFPQQRNVLQANLWPAMSAGKSAFANDCYDTAISLQLLWNLLSGRTSNTRFGRSSFEFTSVLPLSWRAAGWTGGA